MFQGFNIGCFIIENDIDSFTFPSVPTSPSDSMNVGTHVLILREFVVEHECELPDVDSPADYPGGDEGPALSVPELVEHLRPLRLLEGGVYDVAGHVEGHEPLVEPGRPGLRVDEDDALPHSAAREDLPEELHLVVVLLPGVRPGPQIDVVLLDALERLLVLPEIDDDCIVPEQVLRYLELLGGPGGGEHRRLHALRLQGLEDLPHLLYEAELQHLVRLVHHEEVYVLRAEVSARDHVDDPSRGAHHDLGALGEDLYVLPHLPPPDQARDADVHLLAEVPDDARVLERDLPRRHDDQRLCYIAGLVHQLQGPHRECACLARPALCLRPNVLSLDDRHHRHLLDRARGVEPYLIDSLQKTPLQVVVLP